MKVVKILILIILFLIICLIVDILSYYDVFSVDNFGIFSWTSHDKSVSVLSKKNYKSSPLPEARGWDDVVLPLHKPKGATTTFVTAFFPMSSKRGLDVYKKWMKNSLSLLDPMVIFTSESYADSIRKMRGTELMKQTLILTTRIEDSYIANMFPRDFWEGQVRMDPERHIHHNYTLYWVWGEKISFVKQVADRNPFRTKFFLWGDIGAFRNNHFNGKLLVQKSKYFLKFPSAVLLLSVYPFTEQELNGREPVDLTKCRGCDRIGGGFIGGTKCAVERWFRAYYDIVQEFGDKNRFIGKDHNLMGILCLRKPYLCSLSPPATRGGIERWFTIEHLLHGELNFDVELLKTNFTKYDYEFDRPDQFLTIENGGRLGNQLFALAGTIGISRSIGMTPCVTKRLLSLIPRDLFEKKFPEECPCLNTFSILKEEGYAMFEDPRLFMSNSVQKGNMGYKLVGYRQSYKYFIEHDDEIRDRIVIRQDIRNKVSDYLSALLPSVPEENIVGIHVRRGDKTHASHFRLPSEKYFQLAIQYFRELYGDDVRFVVVSEPGDDWVDTVQVFKSRDIKVLSQNSPRSVSFDFALLASCMGGTISTAGSTFSWWANYLGPHKHFVYKRGELNLEHSIPKNHFFGEDYYPPWAYGINE